MEKLGEAQEEMGKMVRLELRWERKGVGLQGLKAIKEVEVEDKNEDISAMEKCLEAHCQGFHRAAVRSTGSDTGSGPHLPS